MPQGFPDSPEELHEVKGLWEVGQDVKPETLLNDPLIARGRDDDDWYTRVDAPGATDDSSVSVRSHEPREGQMRGLYQPDGTP
jgi:hypothetical protein